MEDVACCAEPTEYYQLNLLGIMERYSEFQLIV